MLVSKSIFNLCILDVRHTRKTATNKVQQEGEVNIPHFSWGHRGEYNRIKKLCATLLGQLHCALCLLLHRTVK